MNIDIFQQLVNFVVHIFAFHANLKFRFVRAATSKILSRTATTKKINHRESVSVNGFVNV